jgi:azurin
MTRVSLAVLFLVGAAVALVPARPSAQAAKPGAGRVVEITATDKAGKYLFEPADITAKPGEMLLVRLKSVSAMKMPKVAMSHNFVLIAAKADAQAVVNAAIPAGFAADYVPAGNKDVIASTKLAGIGETVEVSFKAPAAGSYPFVCTFPGHFAAGKKGTLTVK